MLRFKIGDCTVSVSASFFMLVTFILIISDSEIALISLFSSFLHESGHIIAMCLSGDEIRSLSFSATGIRLDKDMEKAVSYNSEILISLAGVGVNALISLIFYFCYLYTGELLFRNISLVNLLMGLFNLLPTEALDGARALYYSLLKYTSQEKADKTVVCTSVMTVIFLIIVAIILGLYGGTNFSLIIVIIYLMFLLLIVSCNFQ